MRVLVLSLGLASFATCPVSAQPAPALSSIPGPVPEPAQLEASGAVIRDIHYRIQNIFNPEDPEENKAIFRLANRLHIKTRESTVRTQLLFKSGEKYSRRLIEETERHLRALDYLYDAQIFAVAYEAPYVDLVVVTRDVWTLQPGASYDRAGGENSSEFEIEEENLLGRGKNISITRTRDIDRTSLLMSWRDPNIWGTRWRDELDYASNDDGHYRRVLVERPFYSLDSRWSAGLVAQNGVRVDPRYDLGELLDEFSHEETVLDLYGGLSKGLVNGWTRRLLAGWRFHHNRFAIDPGSEEPPPTVLPPDRKLTYPWVGLQWVEDRYENTMNLNQINRTEDLYYGRSLRVDVGWSSSSFGADRDSVLATVVAQQGFKFTDQQSLFLSAEGYGRLESGDLVNGSFGGVAKYYWRWSPKRVFFMTLDAQVTQRLDPEKQILLGGDSGLRGYPLRYQTGTSRALFSMEQRFFTDWFPFRLFHVGAAVFFDAGRTWGQAPVGADSLGLLKDVGFGLRLGNARSAFGSVLHFDVAYPLDRVGDIDDIQFLVETKRSF